MSVTYMHNLNVYIAVLTPEYTLINCAGCDTATYEAEDFGGLS